MANIVVVHEVGDFDTWISKNNREQLLPQCCESYRLYRLPDQNKVAVVVEGADMDKFGALMEGSEGQRAMEEDTVKPPVDLFFEVEGAR